MNVGIASTPYSYAMSCIVIHFSQQVMSCTESKQNKTSLKAHTINSSTSILTNSTSLNLAANSLIIGSMCRQGPHHAAAKSITIYTITNHNNKVKPTQLLVLVHNKKTKTKTHTLLYVMKLLTSLFVSFVASKRAVHWALSWHSIMVGGFGCIIALEDFEPGTVKLAPIFWNWSRKIWILSSDPCLKSCFEYQDVAEEQL